MRKITGLSIFYLFFPVLLMGQNYDESKVAPYTLPDVLETLDHQKITGVKDWENIRRPEILSLFEEHVYGKMPKKYDRVSFRIKHENKDAIQGKAHLKEVEIAVSNKG